MKRMMALAAIVFLLLPYMAIAAGTASVTKTDVFNILGQKQRVAVTVTWVDDTAGTTLSFNPATYGVQGWYLLQVETNPGSTAPTDNYDITFPAASGYDYSLGLLANRDTANTERVSIATSTTAYPIVLETFTITVASNSVNNATGTIKLIFTAN